MTTIDLSFLDDVSGDIPTASSRDDAHPRPQLVRGSFRFLDGVCGFAYDDDNAGRALGWASSAEPFGREITLPFAPESEASGIGDTGFHPIAWYRREITADDLEAAGLGRQGTRVILHFGAVDHRADVWVDGTHVTAHVGGQTAFSADVTEALDASLNTHHVVIRAEDDPHDAAIPRGKQDWHAEPHSIWYHRATGIWRSVWLEVVPALHVANLAWTPELARGSVRAEVELSERPRAASTVTIEAWFAGTCLARIESDIASDHLVLDVPIAAMRNGQAVDELLWSPGNPRLVDMRVTLGGEDGPVDTVDSYFGLRSVGVLDGRLLLNDRPFYVRSVLQQGYWPQGHFTAPSVDAMREEIELVKRLGFNSIRIHQKVEDPRYLYWCDRLGLTVWAEAAAAYEFSSRAVELYAAEWVRIVRSQLSHPSVITWVPFNESWGIQNIASDSAQRAYSRALTDLTRSIDPSRPVISNDGWEHTDSDLVTVHDYEPSGEVLAERYGTVQSIASLLDGLGPAGRRMAVGRALDARHIMVTEFGGVRFEAGDAHAKGWGYSSASDAEEYQERVTSVITAIRESPHIVGFCYTQLTDTGQEVNGLCDANRVPKLPEEVIRAIVEG